MIHLAGNAVQAQLGVEREGHVEDGALSRKRDELAARREHHDFGGEQVEFQRIEEVDGAGLGVLQNVLEDITEITVARVAAN